MSKPTESKLEALDSLMDLVVNPVLSYNTKAGIQASLKDLESFEKLVSERTKAGYDRGERLNEFVVMGRYYLDSCGNLAISEQIFPFADNDPVQTREEFFAEDSTRRLSTVLKGQPTHRQRCEVCDRHWSLQDWHDADIAGERTYAHKGCLRLRQTAKDRESFCEIFSVAGFKDVTFTPIENRYWPTKEWYATPWYDVQTPWGKIIIGWRKRVITIDWAGTFVRHLFSDDVTKTETSIHAWTRLNAINYLHKIRELALNPPKVTQSQ